MCLCVGGGAEGAAGSRQKQPEEGRRWRGSGVKRGDVCAEDYVSLFFALLEPPQMSWEQKKKPFKGDKSDLSHPISA